MARRHYNLPPLTALAAFETAARLSGFKRASDELNVTPGAVSHQIRALEADLGVALFQRRGRGVDLTPEGERLFRCLTEAFRGLSEVTGSLRTAGRDKAVTIGATSAVSALWLTPRIGDFWREHPDIAVSQHISDHDLDRPLGLDLHIRYGGTELADRGGQMLFEDRLVPVCAPRYAEARPLATLADLAACHLIHMPAEDTSWTTWWSWFAMLGYDGPLTEAYSVNNYTIALQVARDGGGVVLGWRRLVQPLIDDGSLVALGSWEIPAPIAFYILADADLDEAARTLRDWLVNAV